MSAAAAAFPSASTLPQSLIGLHPLFAYRAGALSVEDVTLESIAAAVGTPVYVYSAGAIRANYRAFTEAFASVAGGSEPPLVCYALKANSNQAVIRLLAKLGAGADVVSEGEMRRALAAGVPPERIVFAGVGKTRAEIAAALAAGIHQLNVESAPELAAVAEVARSMGVRAPVAVRINPDIDPRTHAKIATGIKVAKFGIDFNDAPGLLRRAAASPDLNLVGLAVHIGSQIAEVAPFRAAFSRVAEMVRTMAAEGITLRRLDLGGGLGASYRGETPADLQLYAAAVRDTVGALGARLCFEPGRRIVADAGVLLATVIYVKEAPTRRFTIVDAAMNDLIRPTLYEAHHEVHPLRAPAEHGPVALSPAEIVGPICETGDSFIPNNETRPLPRVLEGERIAFASAGAYGAVMSSTYNSRALVPEVLVDGDRWAVIRARPPLQALIDLDTVPPWLD